MMTIYQIVVALGPQPIHHVVIPDPCDAKSHKPWRKSTPKEPSHARLPTHSPAGRFALALIEGSKRGQIRTDQARNFIV
jgi:hypothetical protein